MKKLILLVTLLSTFMFASNINGEKKEGIVKKENKRAGTSYCETTSVSGNINGNQTTFTTICCGTLPDGHTTSEMVSLQTSLMLCAEQKRNQIIAILADTE